MQNLHDVVPNVPTDLSAAGLLKWILGILLLLVGYFWKLSEGRNATRITDLETRLGESARRIDQSELKHAECEKSREGLALEQATLTERLNNLERKFVHGVDQ